MRFLETTKLLKCLRLHICFKQMFLLLGRVDVIAWEERCVTTQLSALKTLALETWVIRPIYLMAMRQ